jgi:hypothetical protein
VSTMPSTPDRRVFALTKLMSWVSNASIRPIVVSTQRQGFEDNNLGVLIAHFAEILAYLHILHIICGDRILYIL